MSKIFINAGHCPCLDSGAINENWDVEEAEITKSIGELLINELELKGFQVEFEQSDNLSGERSSSGEPQDYYDSVCYHSNSWGADIFISLHCNAFNHRAKGTECFYASKQGANLAQCIQDELIDTLGTIDRGVKNGSHLIVLKYTDCVACLVEMAFIDEDTDCRLLVTRQESIARSIALGIEKYFEEQQCGD